jgi:circadian clock protein KaiB
MADMSEPGNTFEAFEQALAARPQEVYRLRLYVTGASLRSTQAIANLKQLCEEHLLGRYELEVIDLYQQPEYAAGEQVIVAPMLIKSFPPPVRRLIGTLSDQQDVLRLLGVQPA